MDGGCGIFFAAERAPEKTRPMPPKTFILVLVLILVAVALFLIFHDDHDDSDTRG